MKLISTQKQHTHTHTETQSVHAIIKFISWRHTDNNNNNSFTQFAWQASGAERGREEREQCTHSRSTQLSVNSVCPLPAFRSPSSLALSLSCRLLVDQQGNALESAFISGQASLAPLFFSFFFFLFLLSLLLLLFMIYAHRRTHPIAALLNCFA